VAGRIGRIGKMLPEQCSITSAKMTHALEDIRKRRAARRIDLIFNRHHDRPVIVGDGTYDDGSRPMQRRRVICHHLCREPPAHRKNASGGQSASCDDQGARYSDAIRKHAPQQAAECDRSAQDHLYDGKPSGLDP
jgi:hypothetical protein